MPSAAQNPDRLRRQPIGEVFALVASFQVGNVSQAGERARAAVRVEEGLRSTPESPANVVIKPLGLGIVLGGPEMPLAHMGRQVARVPEYFGHGPFGVRQAVCGDWRHEPSVERRALRSLSPNRYA